MKKIAQQHFDDMLRTSPGLVLVDFYADWCGPCKTLTPLLASLEEEFTSTTFIKVNTDENQELAEAFGIKSLPTVLLLEPYNEKPGAKVIHSTVGLNSKEYWRNILVKASESKKGFWARLFS